MRIQRERYGLVFCTNRTSVFRDEQTGGERVENIIKKKKKNVSRKIPPSGNFATFNELRERIREYFIREFRKNYWEFRRISHNDRVPLERKISVDKPDALERNFFFFFFSRLLL